MGVEHLLSFALLTFTDVRLFNDLVLWGTVNINTSNLFIIDTVLILTVDESGRKFCPIASLWCCVVTYCLVFIRVRSQNGAFCHSGADITLVRGSFVYRQHKPVWRYWFITLRNCVISNLWGLRGPVFQEVLGNQERHFCQGSLEFPWSLWVPVLLAHLENPSHPGRVHT